MEQHPAYASIFSALMLSLLWVAPSCFQVESTTSFQRDGSGTLEARISVNQAMMEGLREMGGETTTSRPEGKLGEEMGKRLREAADTLDGLHFDTAYATQEEELRRFFVRVRFDSVQVLEALGQSEGTADMGGGLYIVQQDNMLTIRHFKPTAQEDQADPHSARAQQVGQMLAMNMIEVRSRYLFPPGTQIQGSYPSTTRTDSGVVYEVTLEELFDTNSPDSLYVQARLPPKRVGEWVWGLLSFIVGLVVVVVVGQFLADKRSYAHQS